jgi:RNA polymerase sigma factor (sigma-70 family)
VTSKNITPEVTHRTIVAVDIEGYGSGHRSHSHRARVQQGLYQALLRAFDAAGVPWDQCIHQDSGDSVLVIAPAEIPKTSFADRLPEALLRSLVEHNRIHPVEERIRGRVAVHAGGFTPGDDSSFAGPSIVHVQRLLDSTELRTALAKTDADIAMMASSRFFEEVIRHSEHSDVFAYTPVRLARKETATAAWIRLLFDRALPRKVSLPELFTQMEHRAADSAPYDVNAELSKLTAWMATDVHDKPTTTGHHMTPSVVGVDQLARQALDSQEQAASLALSTLTAAALAEGIKFIFSQTTALLRSRRERDVEAPKALALVLPGQLMSLEPDFAVLEQVEPDLRELRAELRDYVDEIETISPDDRWLLELTDAGRLLLEVVYRQRITFSGEPRPVSGPVGVDEVGAWLTSEFSGRVPHEDIERVLRVTRDDLEGSIAPEELPEMLHRLGRARLKRIILTVDTARRERQERSFPTSAPLPAAGLWVPAWRSGERTSSGLLLPSGSGRAGGVLTASAHGAPAGLGLAERRVGLDMSDADLIWRVRAGDIAAYGELYDRHLVAARRVAAAIAAHAAERDDLIAEEFTRVLGILRSGEGPDEDFRPFLLTTIRNTMISWRRRDAAVSLVAELPDVLPGGGRDEPVGSRLLATFAVDAFASLPERWRTVLWRTEIEGESPAHIAQDLGMTPNGVAALAYRAREGLRQAYLDQHIPAARRRNCRIVSGQLARWVRDGIGDQKAHRITAHLDRCADCRELAAVLRQLNEELP